MHKCEMLHGVPVTGPFVGIQLVVPSDSADLPNVAREIWCKGAAGNVVIDVIGLPDPVTYPIAVDERLTCFVRRIRATGTTATNIWFGF